MLGACFAVLSAISFGLNNALTRRGVLTASAGQALVISVPLGIPMYFLFALIGGGLGAIANFSRESLMAIAATGVIHFICGRYCNYRAVKAMGANLSGPVVQLGLIASLGLGIFVLQEVLTPLRIVGIALVVLGPAWMRRPNGTQAARITPGAAAAGRSIAGEALSGKGALSGDVKSGFPSESATNKRNESLSGFRGNAKGSRLPPFRPRYAEGYLFGLLAAACYGVSPVLIRIVVEHGGLADSMAAGLLSSMTATAVVALLMLWPGQLRHVLAIDPTPLKWFVASGLLVTVSQMFMYLALAVAPVSVVMPVLQLHLVCRYLLARLVNPHHEVFGGAMIVATALSMTGAAALSIDPEFLIARVALPEPWVAALRWRLL